MFDVITVGTATYDVFLKSDLFKAIKDVHFTDNRLFPTGKAECFAFGGKIEIDRPRAVSGGGATNAAATFARQGLRTAALFRVGNDVFGDLVLSEVKKEKIKPLVARDKKMSTGYSTILLTPQGERSILVYRGAGCCLAGKEIPFAKLKSKWVYIVPSAISFASISKIINGCHKNKARIAINPSNVYIKMGFKKIKPLLDKSEALIMNREEAAYLTGVDFKDKKKIFIKLVKSLRTPIVIMTDGKEGSWISHVGSFYQAGVYQEKTIIDRTGAGDAFGSGFVAGLAKGYEVEKAARLASANATSVVERIGAKEGILTATQFEKDRRWRKFNIISELL